MTTGRIASPSTMSTPPGVSNVPTPRVDGDKVRDVGNMPPLGPANMPSPEGGDSGDSAASVHISDTAKHRAEGHRKALSIARATPDIREDRVAALKKQVDEGSYQADPGKIADGMLREAIRDHLAENER